LNAAQEFATHHLRAIRPGHSLPQAFYVDEQMFAADLEAVFAAEWLFCCNAAELKEPGAYLTLEIGRDSIIVVRDRDGQIRAFHNTCRHRGSRICDAAKGQTSHLICPYHQWVYGLDGSLRTARQMPKDFDKTGRGLKPVHIAMVCGLVYVSLADDPPSLDRFCDAVTPYLTPHQPQRTKLAFETTIIEEANWKLVIDNNRECYHCAGNHPELMASLVEFALPDDPRGSARFQSLMAGAAAKWDAACLPHRPAEGGNEFRCIRLPFHSGAVSFTQDGGPACKKLLGDLIDPDLGSVRMFRAPNSWHHFLADHMIHFRVLPLSAGRTALRTTWFVHEDAVEGVDYDIERLTHVWQQTNDQDRRLTEINQRGVGSRAYEPGPFAPSEFMLADFAAWYAGKLRDYAGQAPHAIAAE
jgi:Rieske 2Fe-2S family protein